MLMTGPPGSGKTLIARSMPSILPRMTIEETLDVTRIYSVADQLSTDDPLIKTRPFRAPHHTASYAGLIGGGRWPKPGEISLAHRGVLFLDELPEFGSRILETLRQPLEDKEIALRQFAGLLSPYARIARLCTNEERLSSFANWIVDQVVGPQSRLTVAAG